AQAIHASAEAHVLLRSYNQHLAGRFLRVRLDGVDRLVRAGNVMQPPLVARRIPYDCGQKARVRPVPSGQLAALRQHEERAEGVLHAIDGVLGAKAFATGDPRELGALDTDYARERVEHVSLFGRGHRSLGYRRTKILQPVSPQPLDTDSSGG